MWFHLSCLPEAEEKRTVCGPLGRQLIASPIVRGWESSSPESWMTVGCGRLVEKAKSLYKEGSSQDWGDLLGQEFISFSTTPSFLNSYSCPLCQTLI